MLILVTGGFGFLGQNLIRRLNQDGHTTLSIDKMQDVTLWWTKVPIEQIYNLACPASPKEYQKKPIETTITSVLGAHNMLELAHQKGNIKILQASTSEVYGDPLEHPQTEEYWGNVNPIGPRSCYDEGKRCAESLFMDYHRMYKLPVKIARIFNTYGPYMKTDDGRVVSNFICQALKNEHITIYGDGSQTRSFCYVDDLIDGLIKLMNNTLASMTGPMNLGNPTEIQILELAQLVLKLTKSRSKIVLLKKPQDDPSRRCPDITKAKSIDWSPMVSLEEGLLRTIEYFRGILHGETSQVRELSRG